MERIVNKRLSWLLEKNAKRLKTQAGFRKGRSTMDKIISLDHYIRQGFNQPKSLNTYAVFLDISKAFDSTWIQGLLFKLSNIGITGNVLRWISNLLRNRTYKLRLGHTTSENRDLRIGVSQGSPLSPFQFSIMIDDFPILARPGETLLFADDIECNAHARDGAEAETILTPYLKKVSNWNKKWRFNFSGLKSRLVNFSRQRKKETKPLLFISGSRIPEVSEIKHLRV
jgi:hypothetical protein